MNGKSQLIIILFIFTLLSFFTTLSSYASWKIEAVDAPKYFGHSYYPLSLAVDKNNNPHMTYGGDHLYYAYHNGIVGTCI
jgi:hypothetical protein